MSLPPHTSDMGWHPERSKKKRARFDDAALVQNFPRQRSATDPPHGVAWLSPPRTISSGSLSEQSSALGGQLECDVGEDVAEEFTETVDDHDGTELVGEFYAISESNSTHSSSRAATRKAQERIAAKGAITNNGRPRMQRQSSADEDVDESCFEPQGLMVDMGNDYVDTQRHDARIPSVDERQQLIELDRYRSIKKAAVSTTTNSLPPTWVPTNASVDKWLERRASHPSTRISQVAVSGVITRSASMTELATPVSGLKLPFSPKGSLAGCAVTASSVKAVEPAKINTIYKHPNTKHIDIRTDKAHTKSAQTVRSDSGTLQILWEEPQLSNSSSVLTLLDSSHVRPELTDTSGRPEMLNVPCPMDRVKTKLAEWSWARENFFVGEDGRSRWISLLSADDVNARSPPVTSSPTSEAPFSPPNTQRQSVASSARPSAPQSRPGSEDHEENEDDDPIELKVRAVISRPASPKPRQTQVEYLAAHSEPSTPSDVEVGKPIPRQLSNIEDLHFKVHRDSTELLRRRENEERMNQHLMNSRDSVVLTHSRLGELHSSVGRDSRHSWNQTGRLSPIHDASPSKSYVREDIKHAVKAWWRAREGGGPHQSWTGV